MNEEKEIPDDTYVTKSLDWDKIFEDFHAWMTEETGTEYRLDRYLKNVAHMFFTLITAGGYVMLYLGYYLYKFRESVDTDKYKVEVEHKVYKDGREEERSE